MRRHGLLGSRCGTKDCRLGVLSILLGPDRAHDRGDVLQEAPLQVLGREETSVRTAMPREARVRREQVRHGERKCVAQGNVNLIGLIDGRFCFVGREVALR